MLKMICRFFTLLLIISLFIFIAPFSLADDAPYGALTGKVLDRNGVPLGNASVQVHNYIGEVMGTTISSMDGTFSINKIPITGFDGRNTFRLVATYNVSNKSYSDKTEFFWIYKNQLTQHDMVIYYYPPSNQGWLTGKVVNANNFNQYISATVYLSNGMYYFVSGEPGDNWHFYLPEGDYQVWADHNENGRTYTSGKSDVHVRSDDTYTAVLMISLAGNGTTYRAAPSPVINIVSGDIKQRNDAPLYGAKVELCRVSGDKLDPVMTTTSNVEGYFEFRGVNISSPGENFVVRVGYNFNGSDYSKISTPFEVFYNNRLNVSHDYSVPIKVEFVDSGSLEIVTSPIGARIWIDGADSGRTTPFNFTGIKAGDHACSLLLDGYLPENLTINVPSENTARINKVLKPSTGNVFFTVKPGDASIFINGNLAGKGTTSLTKIPYGKYSYTVSRDGYREVVGMFEVLPGEDLAVPVELVAIPGFSLTYLSYLIDSILAAISNIF